MRKMNHPLYIAWRSMLGRCSPHANKAHRYFHRGITVCERWEVFQNFIDDMGEKPSPIHSLDRIDNNKGYSKDNCKWSTPKEQLWNVERNRWVEIEGERYLAVALAEMNGMKIDTIVERAKKGMTFAQVIAPMKFGRQSKYRNDEDRKDHYKTLPTHCSKGHPYDEWNTGHQKGGRYCKACVKNRLKGKAVS